MGRTDASVGRSCCYPLSRLVESTADDFALEEETSSVRIHGWNLNNTDVS